MIDKYRQAMDRVKTDDEYKAKFLETVTEKQKSAEKPRFGFAPVISYLSTAAAVLLVVYCTALFFVKQPDEGTLKMKSEYDSVPVVSNSRSGVNVIYFTFDGFDEYDVTVESKAVLLNSFEEDYTVANLLSDYYPVISGEDGKVEISDGMVESFMSVNADSEKEINVYVNDHEVLNLENRLVSEYLNSDEDVYFKVTVEN